MEEYLIWMNLSIELKRAIDMEIYHVIQTRVAENDIIEIGRYITNELYDRDAADRLVDEFHVAMRSLRETPERHEEIKDEDYIILEGIRRFGIKNYDIYYSSDEVKRLVYIRRVLHSKREWQRLV